MLNFNFPVGKKLTQNESNHSILNQMFWLLYSQAVLQYFPLCRNKILSKYFAENTWWCFKR